VFFYTALRNFAFKIPWLKHALWQHVDTDELCEVDQPPGACLMVRREVVEAIGLLDEDFPIFFNDVDWCHRIKNAGGKIYYLPQAKMLHFGGKSFTSNDIDKKIQWSLISYRGLEKFFVKTGHPLKARIIKWIIFIDSIVKFPLWGVRYVVHKNLREKANRVFKYNMALIRQWCLRN
jgi:GT2 family glycosyltransferase